jgi:hypothetical protein
MERRMSMTAQLLTAIAALVHSFAVLVWALRDRQPRR